MQNKVKISVSKLGPNYESWLVNLDRDLEIIDLYVLSPGEVIKQVTESAGILLTGGCDIHPSLYGRMEDLPFCRDIDPVRDSLELAVIELALMYKIPLLGICRGAQILNVA